MTGPGGYVKIEDYENIPDEEITSPMIGLVYIFRPEYRDINIDAALFDHNAYKEKYKRLLSSEPMMFGEVRGMSFMFMGTGMDDIEGTRAEIANFVAKDPLMTKNIIESWEIIQFWPEEEVEQEDDNEEDNEDGAEEFNLIKLMEMDESMMESLDSK